MSITQTEPTLAKSTPTALLSRQNTPVTTANDLPDPNQSVLRSLGNQAIGRLNRSRALQQKFSSASPEPKYAQTGQPVAAPTDASAKSTRSTGGRASATQSFKVGPYFTRRGKWLTQRDIDIAVGFNYRYTFENRHNILGHWIGYEYTYTSDREEALAMGIANWQERHGLRIDGQMGWHSLATLGWILIRKRNYDDVSEAIRLVVDGLGYRVAKIKYIIYNPKLDNAFKVVSAGKIEIGNKALKSYTAFRLALRNAIQAASRKKIKPQQEFKPNPSAWNFDDDKTTREQLETFAKDPSTYNRARLSWQHKKFIEWCYDSTGMEAISFLRYLKNAKHKVKAWPSIDFPYEVSVDGSHLKLDGETWLLWPQKVKRAIINIEPRIQGPKLFAWHVAKAEADGLLVATPSEIAELIARYGGYTKKNTIFDERLITADTDYLTRPSHPKWKNLSTEMRACWLTALKKGNAGYKGISAFSNCAFVLHRRIMDGLKDISARSTNVHSMHRFKNLRWQIKTMCHDKNAALYSYRNRVPLWW